MIQIKKLERADIPLMGEVLADDRMVFNPEFLENFVDDPRSFGFLVKSGGKIVGFAYAYALLRPDGKTMFYLHSIGLLPEYQDQGMGTRLLAYILDYAKSGGYSECFVITDRGNPRACHMYEKLGGRNGYEDEIVYVYEFED